MNKTFKMCGIAIAVSAALTACGGADEGFDLGYGADEPVVFETEVIEVSITDRQEGTVVIDLTQGATVGGEAINSETPGVYPVGWLFNGAETRYPRDNWANGQDPVALADAGDIEIFPAALPVPQIGDDKLTPFVVEGNTLVVTPTMFDEALRSCDDSDFIPTIYEGAIGASDIVSQGDGYLDFPAQHTYSIDYYLDNGAGRTKRTIKLTVSAESDLVTDLNVPATLDVPKGLEVESGVGTIPYYACSTALDYEIEDTNIATVDENGMIEGLAVGETTMTVSSQADPSLQKTVSINVIESFFLSLNEDEPGQKSVPACTMSAVRVEPNMVAGELSGVFEYDWSSSSNQMPIQGTTSMAFGEIAMLDGGADNSFAGASTTVVSSLTNGETGGVNVGDVSDASVDVTVVPNRACETINVNDGATPWAFDYQMESDAFSGGAFWNALGDSAITTSPDGLVGNGVKMTINAVNADPETVPNGMWYQMWSTGANNFFGATLGRVPESHGVEFSTNVWVKLDTDVDGPVTLRQYIHPWQFTDHTTYAGLERRNAPHAALFEAELVNTAEWQYVEFKLQSGERTFTVPTSWDGAGNAQAAVMSQFAVYGLNAGDSVTFDEYSLVIEND
ncbi:Ig-like domain-containing protein [Gilvimarinus agarilyticus]|uniref:Ig-like domain-containing protein n=1 Tax=Gilvimarinus sp. 2_MG-2023 TaxID=3062666 RepID=UPI001C0A0B9D|nr:Ig-like domain-containing protein [Gilvimarinus sp. 2_MG-2023]MBU2886373.1 Ig-like domain-containing protein [Gilvimarinus agarilyticus]MDO6571052.1 Ig-like domain-containing protein [Gilvimarinus sp. 2_MG-2023]